MICKVALAHGDICIETTSLYCHIGVKMCVQELLLMLEMLLKDAQDRAQGPHRLLLFQQSQGLCTGNVLIIQLLDLHRSKLGQRRHRRLLTATTLSACPTWGHAGPCMSAALLLKLLLLLIALHFLIII